MVTPAEERTLTAQASLLGALMLYPKSAGQIFSQAEEEDFIDPSCRNLFRTACRLWMEGKPLDPVTLRDAAGAQYNDLLVYCIDLTATESQWPPHLEVLRRESRLHRLRQICGQLAESQDLDQARQQVDKLNRLFAGKRDSRVVTASQGLEQLLERQGQPRNYLRWGFPKLDERLYADLGDFIVIGGRPSAGKTALALNMAHQIARQYQTAFFSLETSDQKLFDRYFSAQAGVDFGRIKRRALTPGEKQQLERQRQPAGQTRLSIVNAGGMDIQQIQALTLAGRYQVIFVDYLQLVPSQGRSRVEEVARVSMALHTLARVHGVTVVALAQLSRAAESGPPQLDSLKESGQIEQDADAVLLLYRAEDEPGQAEPTQDRYLMVAKNKEGGLGKLRLHFDGSRQRFSEPEPPRKEPDRFQQQGFLELPKGWQAGGGQTLSAPAEQ